MRSFANAEAIAAAPTAVINHELQKLLTDRVHDWTALGLLDLTPNTSSKSSLVFDRLDGRTNEGNF